MALLTKLEVRTRQGTQLDLSLSDAENGFIVEEIEGLDPVKATLVSSSFANADGETYHSARRETRNIKLKLGVEPNYVTNSVQSLRKILYSFLMPKTEVTLRFYMDDGLYVDIVGRVETFDSPLFTKEPEATISLLCFNPDFFDPNPKTLPGLSSSVATTVTSSLEYAGDVEAGVLFTLNVNRALASFSIHHTPRDGTQRMVDFVAPLEAGDKLVMSTIPGSKGVLLTRLGVADSMLRGLSPQSNWIELQPGKNDFRVYTGAGTSIPYTFQYVNRYGGL